jgi:hypothetical protein
MLCVMSAAVKGQHYPPIEQGKHLTPAQTPVLKTTDTLVLKLQASLLPETTNTINFQVTLTNVGAEPVVLSCTYTYANGSQTYQDYFKKNPFRLETDPPIYHPTFGTFSPLSKKRNVVMHTLGAGETLTTEWLGECGKFYERERHSPWLTEPGRYNITAQFSPVVVGEEDNRYTLVSDPVELDFGRSAERPALTLTKIKEVDTQAREVVIGAGSEHGVKVGQHWCMSYGKPRLHGFVTAVQPRSAHIVWSAKSLGSKEEAFAIGVNATDDRYIKAGTPVWRADTSRAPDCGSEDAKAAGRHEKSALGEI